MTTSNLGLVLLVGSVVVLAAIVAARVAHGVGLPGLLVFLGLGLVLGEAGAGIRFDDAGLAQVIGLSALVLILAEGGLTTSWAHARAAAPVAMVLATVGVVVSIGVVAVLTRFLLHMGWRESLLLGAVLAPTDAAAVFSVLRRLPLPSRLSGILEGESGLNDPPAVLAVTLLSDVGHHAPSPGLIAGEIVYELAAGAAIGILAGVLGALALRRIALPASGLYPIAILALIVASYGAATLAHASGFLAVYVSALVLGNARLPHGPAIRGFAEGVAWLAQIGLFVMLGLLASPVRLPAQIIPALVVGGVLALLARPAAVLVCTAADAGVLAAAGLLVLGRAARRGAHRAGHHPDERPGARRHPGVRRGVHHRGDQHPDPGADPALGRAPAEGDRPGGAAGGGRGGGAAGGPAGRPAPAADPARVAAARSGDLRAAASAAGQRGPDRPRRPGLRARLDHRAAGRRPAAHRGRRHRAGGDRTPAARGQPRGQAGRVARRARLRLRHRLRRRAAGAAGSGAFSPGTCGAGWYGPV